MSFVKTTFLALKAAPALPLAVLPGMSVTAALQDRRSGHGAGARDPRPGAGTPARAALGNQRGCFHPRPSTRSLGGAAELDARGAWFPNTASPQDALPAPAFPCSGRASLPALLMDCCF